MGNDWRLDRRPDDYLSGATLVRKPYRAWSDAWEHDHCEFCWAKFMDPNVSAEHRKFIEDNPDVLTAGYAARGTGPEGQNDYHWICPDCFNDFQEQFGWRVVAT